MDFILPGRMSATSPSLKPISDETNKAVEQQEDKFNDVPSKGNDPSLPSHQAISEEAEGNLAGAEATTIDSEEITNETLQDLSETLFKEWRDVGRNLKLNETELDNIDADNRRKGQKQVVYQMLLLWKRKHGMKATNKTLRDALIAANRKDLSDYLLNREQCGTTLDSYVETALSVQAVVDKEGRILEIPGTGVRLDIPPGAIDEKCLIEMKIISNYIQEESKSSFTSNTTVVVELLPDNLKLHHRAKLTLPHCLKLKNPVECKAMVFSSHHDQGAQPMWRPKQHALYQLNERNCIIWVESFSWETCQIDDKDVLYKRIQVYAACSDWYSHFTNMELGYYIDLPGKKEIIEKNNLRVLQQKPFSFWKEGRIPLKILLEKIRPKSWECTEDTNPKEIPFTQVETNTEFSCPFVFEKVQDQDCFFYFKATQKEAIELRVPYTDGEEDSAASSSDKLVSAGLYQSQKKTGDESQTVKQPLENIDPEVRTESLRDVEASSPSDSSVPSKSGNVPHSEKRCIDESTAEVIDVPVMNPSLPSHQAIRGEAKGNPAEAEAMTKDSEVVKDETLQDLSENLSKEWRDVGRKLKLAETDLRNIEADNKSNGQKEVVYQMLLLWKRKRGMKATNKTLRDALKTGGLMDLHDNFLKWGKFGTTSGEGTAIE